MRGEQSLQNQKQIAQTNISVDTCIKIIKINLKIDEK